MSPNEFDRLLMKKLSRIPYRYDDSDWEQVKMKLAFTRRKKRIPLGFLTSGVAASVALLFIGILHFHSTDIATTSTSSSAIRPQHPTGIVADRKNKNMLNISIQAAPHPAVAERHSFSLASADTMNEEIVVASNASPDHPPLQSTEDPMTMKTLPKTHDRYDDSQMPLGLNDEETKKKSNRSINFSVSGGINYGTGQTGYAVGAVVMKPLTRKIGVEVRLAYVKNTIVPGNSSPASSGSGSIFQPVRTSPATSFTLNYLQLASMTNFSLTKKLTLSAGADIQKLLQDGDITVSYNSEEKVIPAFDIGLLLKTDYGLSDRLRAGMSYRLGVKNAVSSEKNYLERNYMQVEFRYLLH